MFTAQNIHKNYGNKEILRDISFQIHPNQKVALIGPNGVGKSTLLRIIACIEQPDSGTVLISNDTRIGYLPQEIKISSQKSIKDYLKDAIGIDAIERRMAELENNLDNQQRLTEYGELQERYSCLDGYTFEHRMKIILQGFGFESISANRSLNSLSGGQKSKVALTGLLLQKPNLLLLDEPTNNLDLPSIVWLETFITRTDASCLIISHDQQFLDKLVSKVFEIEWFDRKISEYTGSYTDYLTYKATSLQHEKERYDTQQQKKKELLKSSRQKKQWAQQGSNPKSTDNDKYIRGHKRDQSAKLARNAKSIEKQIERMDEIKLTKQRNPLIIPLVAQGNKTKHAISLEDVYMGYPNGFQIGPINLQIGYGTHVGIIGANGSGKSTLLKSISKKLVLFSGRIDIGSSLNIGNLMQAHEDMPREESILSFLQINSVSDREYIFRTLSKFHFSPDDTQKKIGNLSPGERVRLLLTLFSILSVNVLILDEPTNHLDLEAMETLKHVLIDYSGIIIFVSHDRHFLEKIKPSELFVLDEGSLKPVVNYDDYISSLNSEAQKLIASIL